MRVLMVTPCYYPIKGGTETMVRNLAINLNEIGIKTDIMTFNVNQVRKPKWQGKIEKIDGVSIYRIPALDWMPSYRIKAGVNFIPGLFTHIYRKYDIIHFHEFELSFPLFSFHIKKPKILHLHGINYIFLKKHHISRFLLRHLANLYISISKRMTKELIMLGIPKNKIVYLPSSVDTNLFKPGIYKKENLILFVGRITKSKGLHVLIESLQYLKRNVCLIIAGPPGWDIDYYKNMLEVIEKENQKRKHRIIYVGGLEQSELLKLYQKASLLVLTSYAEGLPVTILESLACETPVVATPVGGIPEIIKTYKTGILTPNDPIRVAKAIDYLLENPDVIYKMGRNGRKLIIERYSLERTVKKLKMIYEQLMRV